MPSLYIIGDPITHGVSSVQLLSCVRLLAIPWAASCQASLSIANPQSPPKSMSIESEMPSNHLILCCCLLLLPSIPLSIRRVSSLHQVAGVLEFQLQNQSYQWTPRTDLLQNGLVGSPCCPRDSKEYSLAPPFKSINSSVLSLLYGPNLHLYITTGKTIALTIRTFIGKVMSLLFNMLSRFPSPEPL